MFNKARLKLTAWYLVIIMVISISFSAVIYRVAANEVERFDRIQRTRIQTRFGFSQQVIIIDPFLVQETEGRIIITLLLINTTIFIVSGIASYFLSGITLTPIKEMVDEQNRFISDASHEINTPLTSLKLAMEVFLRNKKSNLSESKVLIKESIDEVNKLQALSKSLLQLARFEVPNGHTKFEVLGIKEIIDEAIKKVKPMAIKKEIKLEIKIESVKITGNRYSLTDLFVNLLDNAIKYSPQKSVVEISTRTAKDYVEIFIKDSGIGISKNDLPHIFDRFYRADLARSRKVTGGYGLGLSISKKIVEEHGGFITIESKLGKGAIFIVKLPL